MAMICKKCGAEIPDGKLYCPKCGAEVRLVPDFDVSGMQKKLNRINKQSPSDQKIITAFSGRRIFFVVMSAFLVVTALTGIIMGIRQSMNEQNGTDPAFLYEKASHAFQEGDLEAARDYCERAISIDDSAENCHLLMADIFLASGDEEAAVHILRELIDTDDSEAAYRKLIPIYQLHSDYNAIAQLVSATGHLSIYQEYGEYISDEPDMSLTSGECYLFGTRLEIFSSDGDIFYTIDGTIPDEFSIHYDGPILLPIGTTRINAVNINSYGVRSTMISGNFTIKAPEAEASNLYPEIRTNPDISTSSSSASGNTDRDYSSDYYSDRNPDYDDDDDGQDNEQSENDGSPDHTDDVPSDSPYEDENTDFNQDADPDENDEDDDWFDAMPPFDNGIAE